MAAEVVMAAEVATADVQVPEAEAAITPKAEVVGAEATAEKVAAAVAAEEDRGAARVEAADRVAEAEVVPVAAKSRRCQSFGNCCAGD